MKVSVITVCKNSQNTIEATILSVINQTYNDIEFIIVDGVSIDNTHQIIKKYQDKISNFVSGIDTGIYNAMNKGIRIATGDILYFLNSDDILYDNNVIERVVAAFKSNKVDMIYGNIETIDSDTNGRESQIYGQINRMYFYKTCFVQQAIFYKAKCFQECGLFDESYKISGDYDWIVRALMKYRLRMKYLNIFFCLFTLGGISTGNTFNDTHAHENKRIQKHFPKRDVFVYRKINKKYFNNKPLIKKAVFCCMGWEMS